MLGRILEEIKEAGSAVNLEELSRRVGVQPSALEGMIDYLVRQGKLKDDAASPAEVGPPCAAAGCGGSCPGLRHCPFVAQMPRTFSLASDES